MARINQGILGPFSRKVGEVIMKLQTAHSLTRSIKPLIEIGFRNATGAQTPYNNAVSYLMKNALAGEYPEVGIDPSKVMVSHGTLAGADDCSVSTKEDGTIAFSWGEASSEGNASPEDQAFFLAYNFTQQEGASNLVSRKDKSGSIKIQKKWEGDCIAYYIFFASITNKEVSNSEFLGIIDKSTK